MVSGFLLYPPQNVHQSGVNIMLLLITPIGQKFPQLKQGTRIVFSIAEINNIQGFAGVRMVETEMA